MTLDEAIKHCEEKARELKARAKPYEEAPCTIVNKMYAKSCQECAEEHEQLAEWLIHYKELCEIVEHWNDEDCHFTSAMSAFEKILDTFNEGVQND